MRGRLRTPAHLRYGLKLNDHPAARFALDHFRAGLEVAQGYLWQPHEATAALTINELCHRRHTVFFNDLVIPKKV